MARIRTIFIFAAILCMYVPLAAFGQQSAPRKYPSVVLVQLKAEKNRINALANARKFKDLEIFKQDVTGVMIAMIRDFSDHFNYCPVYYFIDTNFDAVMEHKFDGVLLNPDLSPAGNISISDSNYMIVYYGDPTWQTGKRYWDSTSGAHMAGKPNGRGLIINDHNFHQIAYLYKLDFDFFNFRRQNRQMPYKYTSKKFNIEYYPFAAEFNRRLERPRKKLYKIRPR